MTKNLKKHSLLEAALVEHKKVPMCQTLSSECGIAGPDR